MIKFMRVALWIFIFMLTLSTTIMAQDEIEMDIDMLKAVDSQDESYGIEFEVCGDSVKDIRRILILLPNRKRMRLMNTLGLNAYRLEAWGMPYEEFADKFPQGLYRIILFPEIFGSLLNVHMSHDFPTTPEITYPIDGAIDIPLTFTIQWEPLYSINDKISVSITTADEEIEGPGEIEVLYDLPTDATFCELPDGLLQPNTRYSISVEAEIDNDGNDLRTRRVIYFTTGAY